MGSVNFGDCQNSNASADVPTCFSNSDDYLTLLAPGWRITAAGITQGGTSQATPHVAGAIAVLRADGAYTNDSVSKTVQRLRQTGKTVIDPANGQSTPRIDLEAALADLAPVTPDPKPTPDPEPTPNPDPTPDPKPKTFFEILFDIIREFLANLKF